jgi:hypothetical protein
MPSTCGYSGFALRSNGTERKTVGAGARRGPSGDGPLSLMATALSVRRLGARAGREGRVAAGGPPGRAGFVGALAGRSATKGVFISLACT